MFIIIIIIINRCADIIGLLKDSACSGLGNRAYCYAELAISSTAVAETKLPVLAASTH